MQIGQTVKCINAKLLTPKSVSYPPPLIEGRNYVIYNIRKCTCGRIKFDVGLASATPSLGTWCLCGKVTEADGIHWCASERFAEIKVSQEHTEAMSRLKEQTVFCN